MVLPHGKQEAPAEISIAIDDQAPFDTMLARSSIARVLAPRLSAALGVRLYRELRPTIPFGQVPVLVGSWALPPAAYVPVQLDVKVLLLFPTVNRTARLLEAWRCWAGLDLLDAITQALTDEARGDNRPHDIRHVRTTLHWGERYQIELDPHTGMVIGSSDNGRRYLEGSYLPDPDAPIR